MLNNSRFLSVVACKKFVRSNLPTVKPLVSIALMILLFAGSIPPTMAVSLARKAASRLTREASTSVSMFSDPAAPQGNSQNRGMPSHPPAPPREQHQVPPTKAEREARVFRIQLSVDRDLSIASGQRFAIGAVPLDRDGNAVHGLSVEWSTSDKQVVFVTKDGKAIAGHPGTARLVVRASNKQESVKVNVYDDGRERKKRTATNKSGEKTEAVARAQKRAVFAHAAMPSQPDDRLPDTETYSLYQPPNKVGKPEGKTEASAATPSAATAGIETPGSANFTFSVDIESIPGRQLDESLGLTYNSRMWNKVDNGSTKKMYYDVDYGWPAPGFRLGYGQIEYQGNFGFTLTEPDGTRRQMVSIAYSKYRTTDGSLITFDGSQNGGTATYPDGTHIWYSAASGPRLYPSRVTDRHGNYIYIYYVNGAGPKISMIVDTLGRYILFYYSGSDLIAITAPAYNNGTTPRQVVRFYYENLSLFYDTIGLFDGYTVQTISPTSVRVLRYVYFPGTQNGYRFDYSDYGMIWKTYQLRGMTPSTLSLSDMGWINSDGGIAATSEYNYPTTPQSLTDVPRYTARTDDWAGRTAASAPTWSFTADETTGTSTVTSPYPESTVTETQADITSGQIQSVSIKYQGTQLSKASYFWEFTGTGPRLQKVETTNDANQTRATTFAYDSATVFNNVSSVSERDFAAPGTLGTELRRTETTYENSTVYTNRGLIHLPKTEKVFAGGSSIPSSYIAFTYDGGTLTDRPGIIMHDPTYNPYSEWQEQCDWQCMSWGWPDDGPYGCLDWEWVCNSYAVYDSATAYRGNVTAVTSYADAANAQGAETNTLSYDIAGNVTEQTVNCCRRKTYSYSSSYYFAYPTAETRGDSSQLSTSATFDFNTGLTTSTTDENSQATAIHYDPGSLRTSAIDYPDGGQKVFYYYDNLLADASGRLHSYAYSSTRFDSRVVLSFSFFDGRGAVTQTFNNWTQTGGWSLQDIEYDAMGRVYRTSNPYYCSGFAQCAINPEGFWTTSTFDKLGRVTQVTMPRGDNDNTLTTAAMTVYAGTVTTATDQAGKQRRQITDALGRVTRLDEPNTSGSLGEVSTPAQPTSYEYDALNNLIHVTQDTQNRYFKYDSLSRLTYERQVEQDAPWTTSDYVVGNNQWSRKIIYNSQGQIQDAYDARQVNTHFTYDGLNRVSQIGYSDGTPAAFYYYDSQALPSGAPSFDRGYSAGRLVAMTYGTASSTTAGNYFGYDKMGRVLTQRQVTGSATYGMSYSYNYGGALTNETYPSGRAMSNSYDDAGRLSQLGDGTTTFANGLAYAPHGGLTSETLGNGMVQSLSYNRRLQPNEVKLKQNASGAELQRFNYSYGQVNQSDGVIDTSRNNGQVGRIDGYIGGTKQWDQRMSYDSLGRLSTAAEYRGDTGAQTYQAHYDFDRFGNRFQYQSNSNVAYTPVQTTDINSARNRFINTGSTPTTYDASGNILTDAKFRSMNYQYDANGRQTYAYHTDSGGGTDAQSSTYDCGGQRVQTSANGVTRTMVYDVFGQMVADYLVSSGNALERENIYRGGQLLAVYETGASCYKSISDFVDNFYSSVLGRAYNSSSDPAWKTILTQAQAQGQGQLIAAAQSLSTSLFTSSEYSNHNPDIPANRGQFVTDLYAGYLGRTPDGYGYSAWLAALTNGSSREDVRHGFAYSQEFQNDAGQLCVTMTSSGINYVLQDLQGSTRAVMNNGTYGSSTVIARHDYLPFGEEIWSGTGLRSSSQGYGTTDRNRQKYGLTERDDATGLDHTWFRKYESTAGRWTSPDPVGGKFHNPQSFNHYTYAANDPVNLVDPNGLMCIQFHFTNTATGEGFWTPWFCTPDPYLEPKGSSEKPNKAVVGLVDKTLANKDCKDFMKTILNNASTSGNPVLEGGDIQSIFADFLAQEKGGISRERLAKYGTATGRIGTKGKGNGTINSPLYNDPRPSQDWLDASTIVNELAHIAGSKGGYPDHNEYDDYALAQAVHNSKYDSSSSFTGNKNPFAAGVTDRADPRWSNYFHDILRKYCPVPH